MLLVLYFLIVKISQISGCPCENAGTCYKGYRCTCLAHFTGDKCQTALFVKPSTGGLCSYHIQPKDTMSASNAQRRCKDLGGVLAIVETKEKQEAIENVFFDSYGSSMTVYLNFGFYYHLYLDNNRKTNFYPDEDFFPPWGWLLYTYTFDNKVLTNDPSYWYPGKDNNRKLYWGLRSSNSNAGYVCEKHDTGACTDEICNGEPCENRGCTVKCNCHNRMTKTFDCLETQSSCNFFYCHNFGDCTQNGADATCKCRHGYGGTTCQSVIYYRDEEQKDMCEYQVSFMGDYETFGNSRNKCWPWGGSIATIRNKHQLRALENIARRVYSHTYIILWVAGIRGNDGKYVLPGELMLDDITTNDFPRWGTGQPSSDSSENYLQVTTIPSYAPGGSNPERLFYWRSANPSSKSGYICERLGYNSPQPCSSTPCKNGGTCEESGCSFFCTCSSLFTSYNCADCVNPTPCDDTACNNGRGNCTRVGCTQDYTCDCDYGWEGDDCQTCYLTSCESLPCQNGGTCQSAGGCTEIYSCTCREGYSGEHCETCLYDPCASSPCLNDGVCYMANGCAAQHSCVCIPFYEGQSCETRKFVATEETDECGYFADINDGSGDYSSVSSFCNSLNSSLASIKTAYQQQLIFDLIEESYSAEILSFWIGSQYIENQWFWLDNRKISLTNYDGYPKWGLLQPSENEIDVGILISNSPELSTQSENGTRPLVWATYRNNFKNGFVCEKEVTGNQRCISYPCINGGKCIDIGCSYRCVCPKGFAGLQCEFEYPHLTSATPEYIPFSTNFSLSCTVEGMTLPSVIWKVRKSDDDEEEKVIDQAKDEGSPFIITTEYNFKHVVSTITVTNIGLCLNGASFTCWATNNIQKEPLVLKSFDIDRGYYLGINDSYYTFSDEHNYTKVEAEEKCKQLKGELALIRDEITNEELTDAIEKHLINKTWIEENAWIGLQKEDIQPWSNSNTSSYSNWANSEPLDNNSCVYISLESKWKTHSCIDDNFKAHYICEIKNRGVPDILELSTPYGIGGESSVVVKFSPHPDMLDVTHVLRATLVSNDSGINHTEFTKVVPRNTFNGDDFSAIGTIEKLFPLDNYIVTASITPEACTLPISDDKKTKTASSVTASITLDNEDCLVRWKFPEDQLEDVQNFTINITKSPYSYANQRKEMFVKKLKEESRLIDQSSNVDSFRFPALPNRINHVEIIARKTLFDLTVVPKGKCEVRPEAPAKVNPPVIKNGAFETPSIKFNLMDETNGPISCHFVIATSHQQQPQESIKHEVSRTFMDEANNYHQEPLPDVPYIAMALPKTENLTSIDFELGNKKNTSCNIFNTRLENDTSEIQKRSVDENIVTYEAHNIPMVSFRYYSFALVTSTPIDDGDVIFESSQSQVQYINLYKDITVYSSVGAVALFVAVIMTVASLKFAVRSKAIKKNTTKILPYFPVPDANFEILKGKQGINLISLERITKLKMLKKDNILEEWLLELAPNQTDLKVSEAFAKVVKGKHLTDRQRQDFAIEVEIMRRFVNVNFLVEFYGVCFDAIETSLLMERFAYGSLNDYLKKANRSDNIYYFVGFAIQIVNGLQYLQKIHVVHRSLCTNRIFISAHMNCKIGDFGHARVLNHKDGKYNIPDINVSSFEHRWMAPETYHEHIFSNQSEIWSFGIVMWEIFSYGEVPYGDVKDDEFEKKILNQNYRLQIPDHCPEQLYEMMHQCWNIIPMFRPTARKLKSKIQDYAVQVLGAPKIDENFYYGLYYNNTAENEEDKDENYSDPANIHLLQKQFSGFFETEL